MLRAICSRPAAQLGGQPIARRAQVLRRHAQGGRVGRFDEAAAEAGIGLAQGGIATVADGIHDGASLERGCQAWPWRHGR